MRKTARPSSSEIAAAAQWLAQVDDDTVSENELTEIAASANGKLLSTSANGLVFGSISAVTSAMVKLLEEGQIDESELFQRSKGFARPIMVASLQADAEDIPGAMALGGADRPLEYRLSDGTLFRLAPHSRAQTEFDHEVRTIVLQQGSLFVARPEATPAVVLIRIDHKSDVQVRVAPGCLAIFQTKPGSALCTVAAGECIITTATADFAIGAGQAVTLSRDEAAATEADIDCAFDWVENRVVSREESLQSLAYRLAPLLHRRLEIAPDIAVLPVRGIFPLEDPLACLRAIAISIGANLAHSDDTVRIFRGV